MTENEKCTEDMEDNRTNRMSDRASGRDRRKDRQYFDHEVEYNADMQQQFREKIAAPETIESHRRMLRFTVYRRELEQVILRYSRGDSLSQMRAGFSQLVDALEEYHREPGRNEGDFRRIDVYVRAIWIVALGILLDVDQLLFVRAADALAEGVGDAIFERLVAVRLPEMASTSALQHPEPYALLVRALDSEGTARDSLIHQFLDRWYDALSDTYWYGSHTRDDAGYFGYWCFCLAAFVKAFNIDDHSFGHHPHYPRDLVHESAQPTER
jgi:hypothetical protein